MVFDVPSWALPMQNYTFSMIVQYKNHTFSMIVWHKNHTFSMIVQRRNNTFSMIKSFSPCDTRPFPARGARPKYDESAPL